MLSISVRSSSVSAPSTVKTTSLPQALARSRTVRGKRLKTCSTGCIRVLTAVSCRALVTVWIRWVAASTAGSSVSMLLSSLRASTSSPTRSRIEASRSTSTRTVDSATADAAGAAVTTSGAAAGAAATGSARGGSARGSAGSGSAWARVAGCGSAEDGSAEDGSGLGASGSAVGESSSATGADSSAATAASWRDSSRKSCSPSVPVASMARRIDRTASTIE